LVTCIRNRLIYGIYSLAV